VLLEAAQSQIVAARQLLHLVGQHAMMALAGRTRTRTQVKCNGRRV
jgi:hypothetical protein